MVPGLGLTSSLIQAATRRDYAIPDTTGTLIADSAPLFPLIQAATRRDYAIPDSTGTLTADSAPRIDRSCTRYASDYLPGLPWPNECAALPRRTSEGTHPCSGHHGDRPSSRLNQPHRQRTDQPVTGAGRRPHHHGIGTDALSHAAQLSERVAAGGDEGDRNAQLPEDLLNPAARFLSRPPGEAPGAARPSAAGPADRRATKTAVTLAPCRRARPAAYQPARAAVADPSTPTRIDLGPSVPSSNGASLPDGTTGV